MSDEISKKLQPKWRGGFSDRKGYSLINVEVQKEFLDDRFRTRLYNLFKKYLDELKNKDIIYGQKEYQNFINFFFEEFYVSDFKYGYRYYEGTGQSIFLENIDDTIYNDDWHHVLTFIEFWVFLHNEKISVFSSDFSDLSGLINETLKKEFVGYRLINSHITEIIDDVEIESIESSLEIPHKNVVNHLGKALTKLSDRDNPDYENSIKESISSVEAMAKFITDDDKATLGSALNKMKDKNINIHPALESAFLKLYGYTSDEGGIRHAGNIDSVDSTFEEAQFMLVVCSAFNNYMLGNISE